MEKSETEQRIERLKREHAERFGRGGGEPRVVISPLRVCPLGAHVDHQLGVVTGMALENSITMVFTLNGDGRVNLHSMNFGEMKTFPVAGPLERSYNWSDYARGAAAALARRHSIGAGIDAVLEGDLPIGGLSSSAAVGVAYLLALEAANGISASHADNIELDRLIENDFIGLNNGVLDQSVILLSEEGRLLHLDCRDGNIERIQTDAGSAGYDILVVYSGVAKKLLDTDYNRRVVECEETARLLLEQAGREAPAGRGPKLRDVEPEEFERHGGSLPPVLKKRAEHFFSECGRVGAGVRAWRDGDIARFGALMRESGESSINNYECGCPPLIALTDIMNVTPGVYGARFSGAGFRGCCVGLSEPSRRDAIRETIEREYTLRQPEFAPNMQAHFCRPGPGARLL